jgi:hypothetical protein
MPVLVQEFRLPGLINSVVASPIAHPVPNYNLLFFNLINHNRPTLVGGERARFTSPAPVHSGRLVPAPELILSL